MDKQKSSGKDSNMSYPSVSIKYNANHEELEEFLHSESDKQSDVESTEDSQKSKKAEKSSSSILDKYFKAFKSDKGSEDAAKIATENVKDGGEKKAVDVPSEVSGSPIKDYLSKFNRRSESVDSEDTVKENKEKENLGDRWKVFSDLRVKIAQAVEEIKSSRTTEGVDAKDKQNSVDNSSANDSEDNSLQQDLEQNSCASTENQVSSLTSSNQNLSDLSPPVISHSSTMTDNDMESTSSSEMNQRVTLTVENQDDVTKSKELTHEDDDQDLEVESGVDALEDFELVTTNETDGVTVSPVKPQTSITNQIIPKPKPNIPKTNTFFTNTLIFVTFLVVFSLVFFPSMVMTNGVLIGVWISYIVRKVNCWAWNYLGYNLEGNQDELLRPMSLKSVSQVPRIVEFEPLKKYEGWINIYTIGVYDPKTYHISLTQTVFTKLEGCSLRLSFTNSKVSRRALWDEKPQKVPFYQHRIYNLEGAQIKLLPVGIVKKRHWSKKYPICIILKDKSKVTVSNAQTSSTNDIEDGVVCPKDEVPARENDCVSDASQAEKKKEEKEAKSSPRRSLFGSDKQNKLLTDSTTSNLSDDSKKEKLPHHKPIKPILVNVIKEHFESSSKKYKYSLEKADFLINPMADYPDADFDMDSEYRDDDDDDPPVIKERLDSGIDSKTVSNVENDSCSAEEFKEVLYTEENDEICSAESDVLSNNWTKEEFPDQGQEEVVLYLFGRTGREKDEWFRRLKTAIEDADIVRSIENATSDNNCEDFNDNDSLEDELLALSSKKNSIESKVQVGKISKRSSGGSESPSVLWTPGGTNRNSPLSNAFQSVQEVDFWRYMKNIIETKSIDNASTTESMNHSLNVLWLNAIIGRVVFDTFRNPAWVTMLQDRVQKKLSTLRLPSFMGPLTVTGLELGVGAPVLGGASAPSLDPRGLWVDLLMDYCGNANMTLTTQLNLMSLKDKRESQSEDSGEQKKEQKNDRESVLAVYDSDADDTAESSSDEDTALAQSLPIKNTADTEAATTPTGGNSSTKKILRMVDKIAASKYFQHVTEYKYVKRAMEEVSNTDLKLSVELKRLSGTLVVNIPPPPSDRFWFGFRDNPLLVLKAKPIVGARVISFAHVTSWIEKKLCREFEKLLVMPNMEDLDLDCMVAPNID